ncbi:TPA: alkaline phosphatase family protein, partial [Candidatus Micrarchaeota archaeon]|nr:alkaline phosphatase family protein [Candidatus Micrarchaeota archaeon]
AAAILRKNRRKPITSVFPATTATAFSTFYSGLPPPMHEITGYLLRTGRGVCVALKMLPNGAKKQLPEKEVRKTFSFTPFFKRIRAPSFVILPRKIADSAFNMIACTGANRINYEGYAQFVEKTAQAAQRKKGKTFVLAYAEALDVACHCKGPKSKRAK